MATEATLSTYQHGQAGTRLHGRLLVLFWIGWVLLVAFTLGVFFGSLPFYFAHLQIVCTQNPCIPGQPLASTVLLLQGFGLSLANYALLTIVLTILAAFIAFAVAGVLAWRKPDDWMALLTALALVMLVTANGTFRLLQITSPWQVPTTLLNILTWSVIFLNASKKIMQHVPGTELERYVVQKVSILLFVSVFRRAFRISLLLNH